MLLRRILLFICCNLSHIYITSFYFNGNRNRNALLNNNVIELKPPSKEQIEIMQTANQSINIIVNAVAGSGKTTTILHLAMQYPEKKILVLTYNAKLKEETRIKAKLHKLKNLEVHSYHSLGVKYYSQSCKKDDGLIKVRNDELAPLKRKIPLYDVVVLDETQDVTELLIAFFLKFCYTTQLRAESEKLQLLFFGDRHQSIYRFRGSDERIMTLAPEYMKASTIFCADWKEMDLSTSFRLTSNQAAFLNEVVLKSKRIKSIKESGSPVRLLLGDPYRCDWLVGEISRLVDEEGTEVEDIMVLVPSTKSGPSVVLENKLAQRGFKIFVSKREQISDSSTLLNGKILFSTFHGSKGLERKVVIVYNFDSNYFTFFDKEGHHSICPNPLYVALTRSTRHLYLLVNTYKAKFLPFLNMTEFETQKSNNIVEVVNNHSTFKPFKVGNEKDVENVLKKKYTVRELLEWIPIVKKKTLMQKIEYKDVVEVNKKKCKLKLPCIVKFGDISESVAHLNGLAIPVAFEFETKKTVEMLNLIRLSIKEHEIEKSSEEKKKKNYDFLDPLVRQFDALQSKFEKFNDQKLQILPPEYFLELSLLYDVATTKRLSPLNQITSFNWLNSIVLKECVNRLKNLIPNNSNAAYETSLKMDIQVDQFKVELEGRVDVMTEDCIYEIKCVQEVEDEDFLQLAIYAWLSLTNKIENIKFFRLINVLSGEMFELVNVNESNLCKIVVDLCELQLYKNINDISNEEFVLKYRNLIDDNELKLLKIKKNLKYEENLIANNDNENKKPVAAKTLKKNVVNNDEKNIDEKNIEEKNIAEKNIDETPESKIKKKSSSAVKKTIITVEPAEIIKTVHEKVKISEKKKNVKKIKMT